MSSILKTLLVVAACATAVHAAANCEGAGFDLSSLAGQDYKQAQTDYNYIMNICGATADPACKGGSLCQYDKSTPPVYKHLMSIWDGTGAWATCVDPVNCPNGGLSVSFKNGDVCTANRAVTYIFACTPGVSTVTSYAVAQTTTCVYNNVIPHEIGCGGGGGGGGGSGSKSGISGGTVFLIILIVVIPVYIVVGCIYKRQKMGTAGMESCPNIDFWRDFPSLVGDGFKFTWRKLMGLCGRGDGTYENVK